MPETPEFLIDGILPANEVHLLGGSSGSGKTTLIFQTLAEWQDGNPVFGHESHPVAYSYLSLDRSRSSVTRTLQRLELDQVITRVLCQEEFLGVANTVTEVVKTAIRLHPDSRFFIIEGFQTLVGDASNKYSQVSSLLRKTAELCSKYKITILGIAHSPKMKSDESFQHSRELILGSVAWGAYSDTIVTVQLDEGAGNITVKILPRNAASESFHYVFGNNGVLVPLENTKPREAMALRIEAHGAGSIIHRSEILQWAVAYKTSERTGDRVIADCLKNKVLTAIDVGIYERTPTIPLKLVPQSDVIVED